MSHTVIYQNLLQYTIMYYDILSHTMTYYNGKPSAANGLSVSCHPHGAARTEAERPGIPVSRRQQRKQVQQGTMVYSSIVYNIFIVVYYSIV